MNLRNVALAAILAPILAGSVAGIASSTWSPDSSGAAITGWGLGAAPAGGFSCCTISGCNATFCDDFNGSAINQTYWHVDQEQGTLWPSPYTPQCNVAANVTVGGGMLSLAVTYNPRGACPTSWDSGLLNTPSYGAWGPAEGGSPSTYDTGLVYLQPAYAWTCGTIEYSMKLGVTTSGIGLSSTAFGATCAGPKGVWATPAEGAWGLNGCDVIGPYAGTIDWPESESIQWVNPSTGVVYSDFWQSNYGGSGQVQYPHLELLVASPTDPSLTFHRYSIVHPCDDGSVAYYFDGAKVNGYSNEGGYYRIPYYPLSQWFGIWTTNGNSGQPGGPDAGSLPAVMQIDYVRITKP